VSTAGEEIWGPEDTYVRLMARNVATRYMALGVEALLGLVMLPFNLSHLGQAAYGLWALTASVTFYFSVLDLGYGGALVKFVAQYRAWRDSRSLNEILSTVFVVFTLTGVGVFLVTALVAWQFGHIFNVSAEEVVVGRQVLLMIGTFLALRFSTSVFGGVVYGFQRYYINNLVSIIQSVIIALVNVAVLSAGYGLVELVAATTITRILTLGAFTWTAYRVYPGLKINPRWFRVERLREVTGFSVYVLVLDWSAKLNFSADALVIGAMLSMSAVAVWSIGQRVAQVSQRLTSQLNAALFPLVVDSDAGNRPDRLRLLVIQATRLSLALAVPICVGVGILAPEIIRAWLGRDFGESATITRLLLAVVLFRTGTACANTLLKGGGQHRMLAITNSATAVVNILLSVALIGPMGLSGVAIGTLVPVALASMFVVFPAASRRVNLSVAYTLRASVWPAVWPAAAMVAVIWAGMPITGTRLRGLAVLLVTSGLVYQALFLGLAISREERQFYWTKVRQLLRRSRRQTLAAA
jgi:O-antigen/teichoic acid export membrane protein